MSSALSITRAVNPPRAVYLDYPLGHTAGKPLDQQNQLAIMRDTLAAFEAHTEPGTITHLNYEWQSDHSWKDRVMRPKPRQTDEDRGESADDRVERFDTPQYQSEEDAELATGDCPTCVFPELPPKD